jgi:hypothetical protein
MESKGIPNKIHVSEATAKALVALGKQNWLTMRDGQIDVKGKGLMQTYLAQPVNDTAGRTRQRNGSNGSQLTRDTGFRVADTFQDGIDQVHGRSWWVGRHGRRIDGGDFVQKLNGRDAVGQNGSGLDPGVVGDIPRNNGRLDGQRGRRSARGEDLNLRCGIDNVELFIVE